MKFKIYQKPTCFYLQKFILFQAQKKQFIAPYRENKVEMVGHNYP